MFQIITYGIGIGFGLHTLLSLFGYAVYSMFKIAKS